MRNLLSARYMTDGPLCRSLPWPGPPPARRLAAAVRLQAAVRGHIARRRAAHLRAGARLLARMREGAAAGDRASVEALAARVSGGNPGALVPSAAVLKRDLSTLPTPPSSLPAPPCSQAKALGLAADHRRLLAEADEAERRMLARLAHLSREGAHKPFQEALFEARKRAAGDARVRGAIDDCEAAFARRVAEVTAELQRALPSMPRAEVRAVLARARALGVAEGALHEADTVGSYMEQMPCSAPV